MFFYLNELAKLACTMAVAGLVILIVRAVAGG